MRQFTITQTKTEQHNGGTIYRALFTLGGIEGEAIQRVGDKWFWVQWNGIESYRATSSATAFDFEVLGYGEEMAYLRSVILDSMVDRVASQDSDN